MDTNTLLIMFSISLIFIFLLKILEIIYNKTLNDAIYDYGIHSLNDIYKKISERLPSGTLSIHDIFKFLKINIYNENATVDFSISLRLVLGSFSVYKNKSKTGEADIFQVTLFKNVYKKNTTIDHLSLLRNDYKQLVELLPSSSRKR